MKQAIIYARFSPRPDADKSKSCENQIDRCKKYCISKGYEIFLIFEDKGVSGAVLYRNGLSEAINSLKEGMVFIVDTADRLARDMLVELTIVSQIHNAGCSVEYADGTPMRTTKEGRLYRNMLAAFAQFQRESISENTIRGLEKKRENGEWQGRPPIGYDYDKESKVLIENESEQEDLKLIKSMSHLKSQDIAKHLNIRHRYLRGKHWSARTIRKILQSG